MKQGICSTGYDGIELKALNIVEDDTCVEATGNGSTIPLTKSNVTLEDGVESILELNTLSFQVYDESLRKLRDELLASHTIILAMFNGKGGQFIIYKPDDPSNPLYLERVPVEYEMSKSVAHTLVIIYQIIYLGDMNHAKNYLQTCKKSLQTIETLSLQDTDETEPSYLEFGTRGKLHDLYQHVLEHSIKFLQWYIDIYDGNYGFMFNFEIWNQFEENYAANIQSELVELVSVAAEVQSRHWINTLHKLEKDGIINFKSRNTLGVTNTVYVIRQNNILFTILAQFMGKNAINSRLLLFETTQFESTPNDMLILLASVLNDRQMGYLTFNHNKMLMDSELMGTHAMLHIKTVMDQLNLTSIVPNLANFDSNDWPWKTKNEEGHGPQALYQI